MKKAITALMPCIVCTSLGAIENDVFCFTKEHKFEGQIYQDLPNQINEKTSLKKYASINIIGIPNLFAEFKVGLRKEDGSLGYDFGLKGIAERTGIFFGGYGSLLYLFNPDDKAKYYIGGGLEASPYWDMTTLGAAGAPVFSVGRSWLSNSGFNDFIQLNVKWPTISYYKQNTGYSRSRLFIYKNLRVSLDYGLFF